MHAPLGLLSRNSYDAEECECETVVVDRHRRPTHWSISLFQLEDVSSTWLRLFTASLSSSAPKDSRSSIRDSGIELR